MRKEYREYLEKLKEEDYIAWSELTGDPVTGLKNDNEGGCGCIITIIIAIIVIILLTLDLII